MLILAVNCGSSSIKFQLYSSPQPSPSATEEPEFNVILSGSANLSSSKGKPTKFKLTQASTSKTDTREIDAEKSYEDVFEEILKEVEEKKGEGEIGLVAHRIVHGGMEKKPVLIHHGDKEEDHILKRMDEISGFAPLHNHHAMLIVRECLHSVPDATSVLCFDTIFHQTLPSHITTYALPPPSSPTPVPLRKYGFHGLSYSSILTQMSKNLNKPADELNLVIAHLGSGASCCLVQGGKSMNTTMGVTPLDGLVGGTRSGTLDPSVMFHHTKDCGELMDWNGREISKGEYILNKESGFQALCGTTDFGEIVSKKAQSSEHGLAYSLYLSHLTTFLSSYLSSLFSSSAPHNTLHALVFSGGIGEHSSELRKDVLEHFGWVEELAGTKGGVDVKVNEEGEGGRKITKEGSKVPGWVVETDEERVMVAMSWEAIKEGKKGK